MTKKRFFANVFVYESTNFQGRFENCTLLEDVFVSGHVYAMAGETFPFVIVDMDKAEMYFFEEFDENVPIFTIHFKMSYL